MPHLGEQVVELKALRLGPATESGRRVLDGSRLGLRHAGRVTRGVEAVNDAESLPRASAKKDVGGRSVGARGERLRAESEEAPRALARPHTATGRLSRTSRAPGAASRVLPAEDALLDAGAALLAQDRSSLPSTSDRLPSEGPILPAGADVLAAPGGLLPAPVALVAALPDVLPSTVVLLPA